MNSIFLVGRIENIVEVGDSAVLFLKIDGDDTFPVTLPKEIARGTLKNCNNGDMIGLKGYIKNDNHLELVASVVTCIPKKN